MDILYPKTGFLAIEKPVALLIIYGLYILDFLRTIYSGCANTQTSGIVNTKMPFGGRHVQVIFRLLPHARQENND